MRSFWITLFSLDYEHSLWVEQEDLGTEKLLTLKNKRYMVRIPKNINKHVTLRLRGMGKTRIKKTGDLYLHLWLNKGEDVGKSLWLSETSARAGMEKKLSLEEKQIIVKIPPKSHNGLTIRLKGFGRETEFNSSAPFLHRPKRGNLLVRLSVYPDTVTPRYGSFDMLSTEDMALEGWVYRKIDEVFQKMGKPSFLIDPIKADEVADAFNGLGWRGIYGLLVGHLKLPRPNINLASSGTLPQPGRYQKTVTTQNNVRAASYMIAINERFLDNPFSVAAILAHELCHVVYSERIDAGSLTAGYKMKSEKASLEEERSVDLLVFMFKIGEFQLRVARDTRLTLGYFDQEVFERMQVIVSKKLNSF